MKSFPYEFASKKRLLFYPEEPDDFTGDVLEIGPGRGDFLLSEAAANPDTRYVAVELKKRRYFKLARRVEKRELHNVLLIHGDARIVLPKCFRDGTFQCAYVLFPDPWPKRRHAEMRLLSQEFLNLLTRLLRTDGEFIFGTDAQDYMEWVIENAESVPGLQRTRLGASGGTPTPEWIPTFYEQKWRDDGRIIRFVGYRKLNGAMPANGGGKPRTPADTPQGPGYA
jgi:tRNA (guanine-N7-)-methyltransferase